MEKKLKRLPQELLKVIYAARDAAAQMGCRAYLVGGFVRDLLLGAVNSDLDITVEGDGIRFAEYLARHFSAKSTCHKRFGTATVLVQDHLKIDIASARKEFYPQPASLPVVNKGSLKDDLYRRDFTINTLAVSINRKDFGELLDLFSGKEDLRRRSVRILHDLSFIDDPTRLLRAVRFEQRYDFRIEPRTISRFKEAVKLNMLFAVSPQRLRDEIILTLKEKEPLKSLKRLQELAGLGFISPRLKLTGNSIKILKSVQSQIEWFESCPASRRRLDSWLMYLAGLMSGLSREQVRSVCDRFVFSKGQVKRLAGFFSERDKLTLKLSSPGLRASSIFHILEPLSYEEILLIKASTGNKRVLARIEDFFRFYHATAIALKGHDLLKLGLPPGPRFQRILRRILNAKLNGKLRTPQEELEFVKKIGKKYQ
jgi:tRNA nucleotidyltransferase (CCA-adding enzyme)